MEFLQNYLVVAALLLTYVFVGGVYMRLIDIVHDQDADDRSVRGDAIIVFGWPIFVTMEIGVLIARLTSLPVVHVARYVRRREVYAEVVEIFGRDQPDYEKKRSLNLIEFEHRDFAWDVFNRLKAEAAAKAKS